MCVSHQLHTQQVVCLSNPVQYFRIAFTGGREAYCGAAAVCVCVYVCGWGTRAVLLLAVFCILLVCCVALMAISHIAPLLLVWACQGKGALAFNVWSSLI